MAMKSIISVAAIVLLQFMFAQAVIAEDDAVAQSALEFQSERFAAMVAADAERLEEFLADDLSYAHTTGLVETKQQFLQTIESGVIDYQRIVPEDVRVRIYGEVAVMTGTAELQVVANGSPVRARIGFLDVSRRVGGAWQLVAWQSNRLPED
jgi:hypothetical protein